MKLAERMPVAPGNIKSEHRNISFDNGVTVVGVPLYVNGKKCIFWIPIDLDIKPVLYFDLKQAVRTHRPIISLKNLPVKDVACFEADVSICINQSYLATLNLTDNTFVPVSGKSEKPCKRSAAFASSDIHGYRHQTNNLGHHKLRILFNLKQCGIRNLKSFHTAYSEIQNILSGNQALDISVVSPQQAKDYTLQLEALPKNLRQILVETALIGAGYNFHKECLQIIRNDYNHKHSQPVP